MSKTFPNVMIIFNLYIQEANFLNLNSWIYLFELQRSKYKLIQNQDIILKT